MVTSAKRGRWREDLEIATRVFARVEKADDIERLLKGAFAIELVSMGSITTIHIAAVTSISISSSSSSSSRRRRRRKQQASSSSSSKEGGEVGRIQFSTGLTSVMQLVLKATIIWGNTP